MSEARSFAEETHSNGKPKQTTLPPPAEPSYCTAAAPGLSG